MKAPKGAENAMYSLSLAHTRLPTYGYIVATITDSSAQALVHAPRPFATSKHLLTMMNQVAA